MTSALAPGLPAGPSRPGASRAAGVGRARAPLLPAARGRQRRAAAASGPRGSLPAAPALPLAGAARKRPGSGPEAEARGCRVTPGAAPERPSARIPVRAGLPRSSRGAAAAPAPRPRPGPAVTPRRCTGGPGTQLQAAAGGSFGKGEADPDPALGHSSAGRPLAPHTCPPWPRGPGRRC